MIYFLTINYNSKALVEDLLWSIVGGVTIPYKLLIVNNSPQETEIYNLESDLVTIIESGDNIGFGRACNIGIEYVWQRDHNALVWLINPDAILNIGADHYIQRCLVGQPKIAILGTQVKTASGELWFSSGSFNRWTGSLKHSAHLPNRYPSNDLVYFSQWVTGCSLILNLKQFNTCPTFDPQYFLYSEDADFCIRYAKLGYTIAVTKEALVSHRVSAIAGRDKAFMYEHYTFSRLYFLSQHATILGLWLYLGFLLVKLFALVFVDYRSCLGRWRGLKKFLNLSKAQNEPLSRF